MEAFHIAAQVGVVVFGQAAIGPLDGLEAGAALQPQQRQGLLARIGGVGGVLAGLGALGCLWPRGAVRAGSVRGAGALAPLLAAAAAATALALESDVANLAAGRRAEEAVQTVATEGEGEAAGSKGEWEGESKVS